MGKESTPSPAAQQDPVLGRILSEIESAASLREDLIQQIETRTERRFCAYLSLVTAANAQITPDDIIPFEGLMSTLEPGCKLDLMINSPGGLPDATEKLVMMMRSRCSHIRAVVPVMAKSAGTLFTLGCDEILMSDSSELGPTDPQVPHMNPSGGWEYLPAHSFIDPHDQLIEEVNERGELLPADVLRFNRIDAEKVDSCRKAVAHSEKLTNDWLCQWSMKDRPEKAADAAKRLAEGKSYLSHGRVIDWKHAKEELDLEIVYLAPEDALWQLYWEYFVRADVFLRQAARSKVFEARGLTAHL